MLLKLLTALLVIAPGLPGAGGQKAETASPAPNPPEIMLTVTVTDKQGRAVRNVSKDAFTVREGKIPQEITSFDHKDEPLSVGILLDVSGSIKMHNRNLPALVKENLGRFARQSNPSNEYFVMAFTEQRRLLLDWTRDATQIEQALSSLQLPERGASAFYDTCISALEKIGRSSNQKRVLLALTDGQDNASKQTYRYLRELVKRSNVLTYFIHLTDVVNDVLSGFGKSILEELSKSTGGATYTPAGDKDMRNIFDLLAVELRSQYRIGYRPAGYVADGKWRGVKVKVSAIEVEDLSKRDRPRRKVDLTGRTRDGYYAAKNIQ